MSIDAMLAEVGLVKNGQTLTDLVTGNSPIMSDDATALGNCKSNELALSALIVTDDLPLSEAKNSDNKSESQPKKEHKKRDKDA